MNEQKATQEKQRICGAYNCTAKINGDAVMCRSHWNAVHPLLKAKYRRASESGSNDSRLQVVQEIILSTMP